MIFPTKEPGPRLLRNSPGSFFYAVVVAIKTESIGRKLSNFNFQWTKILYHNYLKRIDFFLHFSGAMDVIGHLLTSNTMSYGSPRK